MKGISRNIPSPPAQSTSKPSSATNTAPAPTPSSSNSPAPQQPRSDNFSSQKNPGPLTQDPKPYLSTLNLPPGNHVTSQLTTNPAQFAQSNTLNAYNSESNFKPNSQDSRLQLPYPANPQQNPMVNANNSKVSLTAHQQGNGNANMTFSPLGGPGNQAYYIPYVQQGQGGLGGVQGVPMHPNGVTEPRIAVTGPLNGCAVHAFHNPKDNTMSFMHHANYDQPESAGKLNTFKQNNPHLNLVSSITPQDYAHKIQSGPSKDAESGATVFAHYKPAPKDQPGQNGQWSLMAQLNTFESGAGPNGRPQLAKPDVGDKPQFIEKPINVP